MSQPEATRPARALVIGGGLGLYCVLVWGGYLVVSRIGATGLLQGPEQASLRAIGAGLILLPRFLMVRGRLVAQHGWPRLIFLSLLVGPPYMILFVQGLAYAPASHAGVITPSSVAVLTTLLAWWWLGEVPSAGRIAGLALVVAGVVAVGWDGVSGAHPGAWRGVPFFLIAAGCYASFIVLLRRWRIDGMDASTILSVLSLPYVPLHALWRGARLLAAPWHDLLLQLAMQGPLTGVLATMAFARVIWLLGPTSAGAIGALVPVMATLLGWGVLGEPLGPLQLAGMALAVAGVLCVVLLPGRRRA
jgi:drug/metabolite transporter (DMT)-like permease